MKYPQVFELIRRCKYCGSDMTDSVSAMGYMENPFCTGCLKERIEKTASERGPGHWERCGDYIQWVPDKEVERAAEQ